MFHKTFESLWKKSRKDFSYNVLKFKTLLPINSKISNIKSESLLDLRAIAASDQYIQPSIQGTLLPTPVFVKTLVNLHHLVNHLVDHLVDHLMQMEGSHFPLLLLLLTAANITFATEWSYNKGR